MVTIVYSKSNCDRLRIDKALGILASLITTTKKNNIRSC